MQVQSVIKAVVEEVDDALQLLHSQVYFRLRAVFLIQSDNNNANIHTYLLTFVSLHCVVAEGDHRQCCIVGWRARQFP